ncbi:MAG: chloride channel protein [Methanomicrobiales archaeon]|nr:chloride channel protein [Methanomicrobiales archaeon]
MPDPEDTSTAPVPPEPSAEDHQPLPWRAGFLVPIIGIALVAIAFTAAFMQFYLYLNDLIWFDNEFVLSHRWTIPVGVLVFSLLVGLCQKYLRAPNVIHGGFVEALKEGKVESDYRTFPGSLLSSLFSLLSGACIGPEGTITILVGQVSFWVRDRFRIARHSRAMHLGFDMAALASAFNGIIGNPFFTGVLATEYQIGKKNTLTFLIWNLLAGIVGYIFYLALGLPSFSSMILFPPVASLTTGMVLYAILLGVVGSLIAVFVGLSMKGIGALMEKTFGDRAIPRVLAAGAVIAVVGYFLPALLFSGEVQIHAILHDPAAIGVAMLFLYAILKILLFALSFKSGYIGGPIFPILFSCTMVGLALSLLFPSVPVAIFVLCIEAAAFALAMGAPLTAILLVLVVSNPGSAMMVLVVTSATTALILGSLLTQARARRARGEGAPMGEPTLTE